MMNESSIEIYIDNAGGYNIFVGPVIGSCNIDDTPVIFWHTEDASFAAEDFASLFLGEATPEEFANADEVEAEYGKTIEELYAEYSNGVWANFTANDFKNINGSVFPKHAFVYSGNHAENRFLHNLGIRLFEE